MIKIIRQEQIKVLPNPPLGCFATLYIVVLEQLQGMQSNKLGRKAKQLALTFVYIFVYNFVWVRTQHSTHQPLRSSMLRPVFDYRTITKKLG